MAHIGKPAVRVAVKKSGTVPAQLVDTDPYQLRSLAS